jgi:hypothetical protein
MPPSEEIHVICGPDNIVHKILRSEIARLGARLPLINPRITRSKTLKQARNKLRAKPPTLMVLDPETASNDDRQLIRDLLNDADGKVPVLIASTGSDEYWACETIQRSGLLVWNWDNDDCTLEHLLPILLKPPNKRQLRATIRLKSPDPLCDINIGDASLFRGLRLRAGAAYNRDWRDDTTLQNLFELENRNTAWDALAAKGNVLFNAIFADFGEALVNARDLGAALAVRFEIDPDELDRFFPMPIELLNRASLWDGFFCRIAALARRVKPQIENQHGSASGPPLVLFVDASATRGTMKVIGQNGELASPLFRDLSSAVAIEKTALQDIETGGLCSLEVISGPGVNLKEALHDRLSDVSKSRPVIVHFSGHAITTKIAGTQLTQLVLPSARQGEVEGLSVEVLGSWLPDDVRLVVLSACQGISTQTAKQLHSEKSVAVLGFRWEVQAGSAADFVVDFYKARLKERQPVADAYRTACFMADTTDSAWAAAVLLDHD